MNVSASEADHCEHCRSPLEIVFVKFGFRGTSMVVCCPNCAMASAQGCHADKTKGSNFSDFVRHGMPGTMQFQLSLRLRFILAFLLTAVITAALLRHVIHVYGGMSREEIRLDALLALPAVGAAIIFFRRRRRQQSLISDPISIPDRTARPTASDRSIVAGVSQMSWPWRTADNRQSISTEDLQAVVGDAVRKSDPDCEGFVDVVVTGIEPKSRSDANWEIRGIRFGTSDRRKALQALETVVSRIQREYIVSDAGQAGAKPKKTAIKA